MEILVNGARRLGLDLDPQQLARFQTYYQELVQWNRRVNLTSITDYAGVQVGHFLDSLTVMLALETSPGKRGLRIIDVGTGAGLPGIPLKIVWPGITLVLLEATAKKAEFLRHVVDRLGLGNAEVVVGRAEEMARRAEYREKFELVVSRAVAPLPTLVELCLPFCVPGGCFIAQKKGEIDVEIREAGRAMELLGGRLREVRPVDLPEFTDDRCLVIIDKVLPTPAKYPRRPGIPAKRPLLG